MREVGYKSMPEREQETEHAIMAERGRARESEREREGESERERASERVGKRKGTAKITIKRKSASDCEIAQDSKNVLQESLVTERTWFMWCC